MNRWVVIMLTFMAAVVVGRHVQRFGASSNPDAAQSPTEIPSLGIPVANAEPLPPVESGTASSVSPESSEPIPEGGAVGVPEVLPQRDAATVAEAEPQRQRVPLNPEPPLPEKDRPRSTARAQGPLTNIDPHQMLFEPGEKAAKPAQRRKQAAERTRRAPAPTSGPMGDIDPRQMLFEPGEQPPQGWVRKTPVEPPVPKVQMPEEESTPEAAVEPPLEPGEDAQAKTRIMKRLLRVMELAGEKP